MREFTRECLGCECPPQPHGGHSHPRECAVTPMASSTLRTNSPHRRHSNRATGTPATPSECQSLASAGRCGALKGGRKAGTPYLPLARKRQGAPAYRGLAWRAFSIGLLERLIRVSVGVYKRAFLRVEGLAASSQRTPNASVTTAYAGEEGLVEFAVYRSVLRERCVRFVDSVLGGLDSDGGPGGPGRCGGGFEAVAHWVPEIAHGRFINSSKHSWTLEINGAPSPFPLMSGRPS